MSTVLKSIIILIFFIVCVLLGWFIFTGHIIVDESCIYQGPFADTDSRCEEDTDDVKGVSEISSMIPNVRYTYGTNDYDGYTEITTGSYFVWIPANWVITQSSAAVATAPLEDGTGEIVSLHVSRISGILDIPLYRKDCEILSDEVRIQLKRYYTSLEVYEDGLLELNSAPGCYMYMNIVIRDNTSVYKRYVIPDEANNSMYIIETKSPKGSVFEEDLEKIVMSFQLQ